MTPTPKPQRGGWRVLRVSPYTTPGKNFLEPLFTVVGVCGSRVQKVEKLTTTQVEDLDLALTWRKA